MMSLYYYDIKTVSKRSGSMEKIRMTIRIVPELSKAIERSAKEQGKSKNAIIIDACWSFIEKTKK